LNTYNLRLERPFDDSVWIIFYVLGGFLIFMAATIIFTLACREKRLAHAPSFNAQQSIINTLRSVQTPMGYPSGIPPPFPQVYHPSGRVSVNTGLPVNANNLFPTPITRTWFIHKAFNLQKKNAKYVLESAWLNFTVYRFSVIHPSLTLSDFGQESFNMIHREWQWPLKRIWLSLCITPFQKFYIIGPRILRTLWTNCRRLRLPIDWFGLSFFSKIILLNILHLQNVYHVVFEPQLPML
jgi:hypothetical protein